MSFLNGYGTAAFTLARVFTGTTIVARFTSTLALAVVHALAIVFSTCGTTTMAFTRILSSTTSVTSLASAMALACIHALTDMLITFGISNTRI
jgi:hypothetical protein